MNSNRNKPLIDALWAVAADMEDHLEHDFADDADLIRALARMVGGSTISEAFGAPGDWGYNTPLGKALFAVYSFQRDLENLPTRAQQNVALDARRYRRLRILGVAPNGSKHLEEGTVLRFTNLDEYTDRDLRFMPSRGEAVQPKVADNEN